MYFFYQQPGTESARNHVRVVTELPSQLLSDERQSGHYDIRKFTILVIKVFGAPAPMSDATIQLMINFILSKFRPFDIIL